MPNVHGMFCMPFISLAGKTLGVPHRVRAELHLDVEPCLGTGLDEDDAKVARFGVSLLDGYLPVVTRSAAQ